MNKLILGVAIAAVLVSTANAERLRPVNHDSHEFKDAIEYRNKVNKYYDSVRTAIKVK